MKVAYLDTIAGIAGDMTMAAFVSAGLPIEELSAELAKLRIPGFELVARHVRRNAIDAVHIDVVTSEHAPHHRGLKEIFAIIDGSTLSPGIRERARAIFTLIAEAEAKVHNTPIETVHFHEVGALDSIVDVVGAAVCMERMGIERVYSSPVRLGSSGLIETRHGVMPVPAPATVEILRDYPTVLTGIAQELTTPTGAAIVKALSAGILDEEAVAMTAIGYGAGTKEFRELPNLLRVIIGTVEAPLDRDEVVVIETNIDDMNPQVYPFLIEQLLASGAHDAYLVPIVMKKGRPGILLSAMVEKKNMHAAIDTIYRQTSTIGLRVQTIGRLKLPRRSVDVQTSLGPVRAKAVIRDGREALSAEYEECRRIALERKMSILEVMRLLDRELSQAGTS